MLRTANQRIAVVALIMLTIDQLTKLMVNRYLQKDDEKVVIRGFFKFVHWVNTGAAWSLFTGKNTVLAVVAVVALVVLFRSKHHFDAHTRLGQIALGLIFGGIIGNLIDRLRFGQVTDFLYFYMQRRGGGPDLYFPAFNIADSSICIGVALMFLISLRNENNAANSTPPKAG